MVVPIEPAHSSAGGSLRSFRRREVVANAKELRININTEHISIIGNSNRIFVHENRGAINVIGNDSRVRIISNTGKISYMGNSGRIYIGSGSSVTNVKYTGCGGTVKSVPVAVLEVKFAARYHRPTTTTATTNTSTNTAAPTTSAVRTDDNICHHLIADLAEILTKNTISLPNLAGGCFDVSQACRQLSLSTSNILIDD